MVLNALLSNPNVAGSFVLPVAYDEIVPPITDMDPLPVDGSKVPVPVFASGNDELNLNWVTTVCEEDELNNVNKKAIVKSTFIGLELWLLPNAGNISLLLFLMH